MALNTPAYGRRLGFSSPPLILNNDGFFDNKLIGHKLYHMISGRPKAKDEPVAKKNKAISDTWAILSDDESGAEGTARKLRGHRKTCKPGCAKDHDYSHAKDLARRLRVLAKNPELLTEQLEMRFTEVDRLLSLAPSPIIVPKDKPLTEEEMDQNEKILEVAEDDVCKEDEYHETLRMCTMGMIASMSAIARRRAGNKAWRKSAEERREEGCAVWQAWNAQKTARTRIMKARRKIYTMTNAGTSCCQGQCAHRETDQNFLEDLWKEGEQDHQYHYADGCLDCVNNMPPPKNFNCVMGLYRARLTEGQHNVYNSIMIGDPTGPPEHGIRVLHYTRLSTALGEGTGLTMEQLELQLQRRALAIRSIPRLVFHSLAREEAKLLYFQIMFAPYGMAPVADYDPDLDMRANAENNVRRRWCEAGIWRDVWGPAWTVHTGGAKLDKAVKNVRQRAMMDDPVAYGEYAFPFGSPFLGFAWPHEFFVDTTTDGMFSPVFGSLRMSKPSEKSFREPGFPNTRPNDVAQVEIQYSTRAYTKQAEFCRATNMRGHNVDLKDINGGLRVAQGFLCEGELGYGVYEWPHEKMAREEVLLGEAIERDMARKEMVRKVRKSHAKIHKTYEGKKLTEELTAKILSTAYDRTLDPDKDKYQVMEWIYAQMDQHPRAYGDEVRRLIDTLGTGTLLYSELLRKGLSTTFGFAAGTGHDAQVGAEPCTNERCSICAAGSRDDADMDMFWRKTLLCVRRSRAQIGGGGGGCCGL